MQRMQLVRNRKNRRTVILTTERTHRSLLQGGKMSMPIRILTSNKLFLLLRMGGRIKARIPHSARHLLMICSTSFNT